MTKTMPETLAASTKRRSKRHYIVNRRLLVVTLGLLVVVLPAAYFWYKHQLRQSASALLARAELLQKDKDWDQATAYYQRYLLLEPDDTQALVEMVEAVAKGERTPARLNRLNGLLYRTIGRVPDRPDLRRMLAENLLKLGAVEEAKTEAEWLVKNAPQEASAARRIIALSLTAQARLEGDAHISDAIRALLSAAAESPGDVELVEVAADTLRKHPTAIDLPGTDAATVSDQMMDQLVNSDPTRVEARLARYRYRLQNRLTDPASDLKAALDIQPDNLDAILLAALSATADVQTDKQQTKAESLLRRAIGVAPTDPRAYLILARLLEQSDRRDEAATLLQKAQAATDNNFDVALACANTLISANKLEAAEKTLRELESQTATYLVQLDGAARIQVENRLRLLQARLDLAHDKPRSAVTKLHAILLATEAKAGYEQSLEWLQATGLLAQTHARSGEWDKASEYWGNLAKALPEDHAIVTQAVDAYLKTANAGAAIATIDDLIRLAEPTEDLLVKRAQVLLALQLSRPDEDRNWTEYKKALETAKSAVTDNLQLLFCEAVFLIANSDHQGVTTLLHAAEDKYSEVVEFWQTSARIYSELGQQKDAERALAKHRVLARSASDHAALEATLLAKVGKHKQADELLVALGKSLSPIERKRIERLRISFLTADNNLAGALQLIQQLIEIHPKDTELLTLGIEIALGAGELGAAEAWESVLRELTDNDPNVRYLRARRLLLSFDRRSQQEKQDLDRSIKELRAERPKWYPAVALAALYASLQGDSRQALADYSSAFELGDRRPEVLQQIITLLFKEGRFEEAQKYLSYRTANDVSVPFFDAMAIELAIKQDRSASALEIARQSVERFPDDAMHRITLANLLIRYGDSQEGLEVLRNAVRAFKSDSRVWLGLFAAFVQTGQADEARKTLNTLVKSSVLPPNQRYLVAAQGYELMRDYEGARRLYKLAIDQDPEAIATRLKYAKLLTRVDPAASRKEYEQILKQDPVNGEARRGLATLLAATRDEADWMQISQLLTSVSGESSNDANTNDRLRAMLLSQKGRTRADRISNCQTARSILQRLIETENAEASDLDRMVMAQVLQQEAELSENPSLLLAARDQLRAVVDRLPTTPEKLLLYVEFLLRQATNESNSVEKLAINHDTKSDVADLKESFLSEAETRLGQLRQLPSDGEEGREAMTVAFQARVLHARGKEAEAKAYIKEFAARQSEKNQDEKYQLQRYLMIGRLYSSIGAHTEAEKSYRQLMEHSPNGYVLVVQSLLAQDKRQEAIELCLNISKGKLTPEMATLLANVTTATDGQSEELPQVKAAIAAAVNDHSENIELLQAEAVRRASRRDYDGAVTMFRRILELDPGHVLTLNNLATMLAEKPNQRAEALEHIQRAIEIAGRQASLLDTQGTILLKLGETDQAIACLEEATAGEAADARYYLHLAAAYEQAERHEEARRMLVESRAFGLEKFVLTDDDRKMLIALDEN